MKRRLAKILCAVMAAAMLVTTMLPAALAEDTDKKETVYVIASADGTPSSVIVSERLYNRDGAATIEDVSRLTDIENVDGDETFTQNGETIVWNANGQPISYEGRSDEELPVGVKLTYTLDGKTVTPEELKGASGHLVISVEYTATKTFDATVDGETVQMPLPFLAATVLLADDSNYKNIEVTNGYIVDAGNLSMVMCYGMPGMNEALNLSDEESDIPTTAEISADVTDYACSGTYTFATNSFLKKGEDGVSIEFDEESLTELVTDVLDGIDELEDGVDKLKDGAQELNDGAGELSDGLDEIDSNSADLVDGASKIVDAIIDTANEELEKSRGDFAKLGIELNTITRDNYDTEITRLERELLDNVEDYVYEQAEKQLRDKVNAAVRAEVVKQVNAGAKDLVVQGVNEAAEAKVRAGVEAAARKQVEDAINNPDEATINAEVEKRMQTPEVQQQINDTVAAQMASPAVQSLIEQKLDENVTAGVKSATEAQVRAAVEAQRPAIEAQVTAAIEAQVRQQVEAKYAGQNTTPTTPSETPDPNDSTDPIEDAQTESAAATDAGNTDAGLFIRKFFPGANAEDASGNIDAEVAQIMASQEIQDKITSQTDAQIDALVSQKMDSSEVQQQMAAAVEQKKQDPTVRAQVESAVEAGVREQVEAGARQKIVDGIANLTPEEKAALVEQKMQSPEVQALIEQNVQAQMASPEVQQLIKQNIAEQMQSEDVKTKISTTISQQMSSAKVRRIIAEQIVKNRSSKEYLDGVATALEENGENGEAYRALADLYDSLSDLMKFYNGVCDYTDAVGEAADGAKELYDGTTELVDGVNELVDRLDEVTDKIDDMEDGPIKTMLNLFRDRGAEVADRLTAVYDMMEDYNSFAGIAPEMNGTVQFMIHTKGI